MTEVINKHRDKTHMCSYLPFSRYERTYFCYIQNDISEVVSSWSSEEYYPHVFEHK